MFFLLDTCESKTCPNNSKCIAMKGKGSMCKCPRLEDCPRKIQLVCAKLEQKTFINDCAQKVYSCLTQKTFRIVENDYCCKYYCEIFFVQHHRKTNFNICFCIC